MKGMELWGYSLLAALAVALTAAPAPSAPHGEPRAVSAPQAPRAHTGVDHTPDRRRPAPAASERERDAALLLMLGDAAAHWKLR